MTLWSRPNTVIAVSMSTLLKMLTKLKRVMKTQKSTSWLARYLRASGRPFMRR